MQRDTRVDQTPYPANRGHVMRLAGKVKVNYSWAVPPKAAGSGSKS